MTRRPSVSDQRGSTLTVAIMSLALMITLGGVGLQQAVNALRHSSKQTNVKRALQAADAAVEAATYAVARLDLGGTLKVDPLNPNTLLTQNCVVNVSTGDDFDLVPMPATSSADADGNRWCPATTPEPMPGSPASETAGGGATFSYRISQLARVNLGSCVGGTGISLQRYVVGVGRAGDEVRRVWARLAAPIAVLSGAAVQSSSSTVALQMSGAARIVGGAQANANIVGSPSQTIVGNANPGPGMSVNSPGPSVTGSRAPACAPFTIPDVDQGNAPVANHNTMYTTDCVSSLLGVQTTCTGADKVTYNAATRTLTLSGNARATLTGSTYSFCSIVLEGHGMLRIPSTSPNVRIFLDDPANCKDTSGKYLPGAGTIRMSQASRIVNCHLDTQPQSLQLYAVGNPDVSTTQILSSGGPLSGTLRTTLCGVSLPALLGEPMVILAPHSRVELGGTVAISGTVAAKEVRMAGNSSVTSVNSLVSLDELGTRPVLPLYRAADYRECTGRDFAQLPATAPAQGC